MKYILVLIVAFNTASVNSETTTSIQSKFEKAKELISKNCIKCTKNRSITDYLLAVNMLENIVDTSNDMELKHKSLTLLSDSYAELAYGFYKSDVKKREIFRTKRRNSIEKILKNSTCIHPKAILDYVGYNNSNKEKLATLRPILKLQSSLFEAKYLEGKILIEEGEVENGLESLTLAIHLASYGDAHYHAYDLAWIMKEHGKMDLAYKIMNKKYGDKMDKKAIDELLNRK